MSEAERNQETITKQPTATKINKGGRMTIPEQDALCADLAEMTAAIRAATERLTRSFAEWQRQPR